MIPKHVLSCWFGRGQKSDLFLRCREAKEKFLPRSEGWVYIDVDEDNCGPLMTTTYMRSVIARGEFVKCTELARIWALLEYGGVYMDEDVEPVRSFDPLLSLPHVDGAPARFFIGREGGHKGDKRYVDGAQVEEKEWINGAVMGSEKASVVSQVLYEMFPSYSDGRGRARFYGPEFLTREIEALIRMSVGASFGSVVLKKEAFAPFSWYESIPSDYAARVGPDTFAVHHFAKSWAEVPGC